ncbi:MAG: helicase-related protein, partial [Rhodoferax sp.]|nr:helicase-related protein [Rhodoferax sp.]
LDLGQVQMLVLDEADRMLDMGFIHDVKKVLALVPKDKQSLLFSATFSDDIRDLANNLLKNPQSVQVTPRNTTVQRITQVIHPVGRSQKKALLAHIINQNNWSQVLVFTRTKFGANHVAEFLEKNGITAMALHGNKSQAARTQALAGFKTGEVRALVATDIAARGIDIDDLPHVVNYEIPNVSEDYVHRIGRTGRAGADGAAVNLVCLDEQGFMQDIERFTKQTIEVQVVDGFGPEAGEKAEPIAMGRQTIWGGAGKPPSRDVMQAAAKAARTEMLQRMRDNKGAAGATGSGNAGRNAQDASGRGRKPGNAGLAGLAGNAANGVGTSPTASPTASRGQRTDRNADYQPVRPSGQRPSSAQGRGRSTGSAMPQPGRGYANEPRAARAATSQPDPMRTSVDLMAERGARRSYGSGNRTSGASGGERGYGGGRSDSFGGSSPSNNGVRGSRGPGSFSR